MQGRKNKNSDKSILKKRKRKNEASSSEDASPAKKKKLTSPSNKSDKSKSDKKENRVYNLFQTESIKAVFDNQYILILNAEKVRALEKQKGVRYKIYKESTRELLKDKIIILCIMHGPRTIFMNAENGDLLCIAGSKPPEKSTVKNPTKNQLLIIEQRAGFVNLLNAYRKETAFSAIQQLSENPQQPITSPEERKLSRQTYFERFAYTHEFQKNKLVIFKALHMKKFSDLHPHSPRPYIYFDENHEEINADIFIIHIGSWGMKSLYMTQDGRQVISNVVKNNSSSSSLKKNWQAAVALTTQKEELKIITAFIAKTDFEYMAETWSPIEKPTPTIREKSIPEDKVFNELLEKPNDQLPVEVEKRLSSSVRTNELETPTIPTTIGLFKPKPSLTVPDTTPKSIQLKKDETPPAKKIKIYHDLFPGKDDIVSPCFYHDAGQNLDGNNNAGWEENPFDYDC